MELERYGFNLGQPRCLHVENEEQCVRMAIADAARYGGEQVCTDHRSNHNQQIANPKDTLIHAIAHLSVWSFSETGWPEAKQTLSACLGEMGHGQVSNVLGETRVSNRWYGDGSFDCPFCHNPIAYPATECSCPFCVANPGMSRESAQAMVDKAAREKADREERERNHKWAMERIAADNAQREREELDAINYARSTGACVQCLVKSRYRKFTKHRTGYQHAA